MVPIRFVTSAFSWEDMGAQDGPGIAELDAPAGAYPRVTGGPTMFAHPHPPRIDGLLR